jgi:ribonuclease PH
MKNPSSKQSNEIRPVRITPGFVRFPQGSCLIEVGETRVICTATVEESVPKF